MDPENSINGILWIHACLSLNWTHRVDHFGNTKNVIYSINRGSYMCAHVLLNLLMLDSILSYDIKIAVKRHNFVIMNATLLWTS